MLKLFKCRHEYKMFDIEFDHSKTALYIIHTCAKCGEEYIIRIKKICDNCLYRKTRHCPNSGKCYALDDKPYWCLDDGAGNEKLMEMDSDGQHS